MAEERNGIFAGDDPVAILQRWLGEATATEINDPNAISLATVDGQGLPNVRTVLLKEIEADGFVFYTNYESAKGQELITAGKAAFLFHWKSLRRQIRVRGMVEKEGGPQADAYYKSRPLGSQHGAWTSPQSKPIPDRAWLEAAAERVAAEQGDNPKRPPFWGGFRLKPLEMEFWSDGEYRLHDRFVWQRDSLASAWDVTRLGP